MSRRWWLGVILAGVGVLGCEQTRGAALIVNVRAQPIDVRPEGEEAVRIEAGDAKILTGPLAGLAAFEVTGPDLAAPDRLQVELKAESVALVSPYGCVALVDYTPQYQPGGGPITVVAQGGGGRVGRIPPADFRMVRGPGQPLPEDVYKSTPVVRLTHVPCEVMADFKALQDQLSRMD